VWELRATHTSQGDLEVRWHNSWTPMKMECPSALAAWYALSKYCQTGGNQTSEAKHGEDVLHVRKLVQHPHKRTEYKFKPLLVRHALISSLILPSKRASRAHLQGIHGGKHGGRVHDQNQHACLMQT
jgi:hypothetical protein